MRYRYFTNPLLLLIAFISVALFVPALFMDGMFMDGLLYTCVGKNLGNGIGSFWDPQFSETYMRSYHEQPPLMFGLLAVFFKIFGNGLYTERVYCLVMAVSCFFSFRLMWNEIFYDQEKYKDQFWLPLLFFFFSPVTFWSYTNNVEESTMVVFTILSVAFQLRAIRLSSNSFFWSILGGVAVTLSTLCKGLQGGFPLILPALWFLTVRSLTFRKAMFANLIILLVPIFFYVFVAIYEPARNSYTSYFHDRIFATFSVKETATTSSRFYILLELLLDLLPAISVCIALSLTIRKFSPELNRKSLFFLLFGMSGVLPLMITLEQRGFYLVTALPFLAVAIALPIIASAEQLSILISQRKFLQHVLNIFSVLILAGTLTATVNLAGIPKRDSEMLKDVGIIGLNLPDGAIISADPISSSTWSLLGYLQRYHNISVVRDGSQKEYHVVSNGNIPPKDYFRTTKNTSQFHLYRNSSCKSPN